MDQISFVVSEVENDEPLAVAPVINGLPLADRVSAFEFAKGFEPAGGYAGIVPANFDFGPLDAYFGGEASGFFAERDWIWVLGCTCGEVGCWPLRCCVKKANTTILWDTFGQPHRPQRDYSEFGPFTFEVLQYRAAVRELADRLNSRVTASRR